MSTHSPVISPWVTPIAETISSAGHTRGFFVALGAYRPDLIRVIADELGCQFFDFREEVLQPRGWEAGRLPLTAISKAIEMRCEACGLVVHNTEALLATKGASDRKQWFTQFANRDWQRPVIVPVVIYQSELPTLSGQIVRIEAEELPSETLLMRLAGQ